MPLLLAASVTAVAPPCTQGTAGQPRHALLLLLLISDYAWLLHILLCLMHVLLQPCRMAAARRA